MILSQDILFDYNRDNYFSELKETEIMKERLEMMRDVGEFIGQYFSEGVCLQENPSFNG